VTHSDPYRNLNIRSTGPSLKTPPAQTCIGRELPLLMAYKYDRDPLPKKDFWVSRIRNPDVEFLVLLILRMPKCRNGEFLAYATTYPVTTRLFQNFGVSNAEMPLFLAFGIPKIPNLESPKCHSPDFSSKDFFSLAFRVSQFQSFNCRSAQLSVAESPNCRILKSR
jgi:hypothetical protein